MIVFKVKTKENVFFGRHYYLIALATVRVKVTFMLLCIILLPKYIYVVLLDLGTCRISCGELSCMVPIKASTPCLSCPVTALPEGEIWAQNSNGSLRSQGYRDTAATRRTVDEEN